MFTWLGLAILFIAAIVLLLVEDPGRRIGISSDDFAQLAQGIALLLVAGSGVLLSYRGRGSEAVKHAAGWLAFALFLLVLYTYRGEFAELGRRVVAELVPSAGIVRAAWLSDPISIGSDSE